MAQLTEWLQIMVGEINRKREDAEKDRAEEQTRQQEASGAKPAKAEKARA